MPEISASEAVRRFSDVLDSIEHDKARYTIIRRGKAVASLEPIITGRGSEVKRTLRRHVADKGWSAELGELGEPTGIDVTAGPAAFDGLPGCRGPISSNST